MELKRCPVEHAASLIGRRWSFELIRDMLHGKRHFNEFLKSNPELSSKMLAERLKDLEDHGIITRKVIGSRPVSITYELTKKGMALKKVLYELAVFAIREFPNDVCRRGASEEKALEEAKELFR